MESEGDVGGESTKGTLSPSSKILCSGASVTMKDSKDIVDNASENFDFFVVVLSGSDSRVKATALGGIMNEGKNVYQKTQVGHYQERDVHEEKRCFKK